MPYVPSKKTDGESNDRIRIDAKVIELSRDIVNRISTNREILLGYLEEFIKIGTELIEFEKYSILEYPAKDKDNSLAGVIYDVGKKYNYQGAFLGELNYAITRLIQEVPKELVKQGKQVKELRYFIYAYTVEALVKTTYYFNRSPDMYGIAGVFEDIKDEYKVRVNKSYEIAQILKSGDCYDTPYFNKVVEVINEEGTVVGHTYIELINDGQNEKLDKMPYKLIVREKNGDV